MQHPVPRLAVGRRHEDAADGVSAARRLDDGARLRRLEPGAMP